MPQQITMWKTSSGEVYNTKEEAEAQEILEAITKIIDDDRIIYSPMEAIEIFRYMVSNKELAKLLAKYAMLTEPKKEMDNERSN